MLVAQTPPFLAYNADVQGADRLDRRDPGDNNQRFQSRRSKTMRVQSVFEVAGVAAVTMVFTLMAFSPWNVGISDEAKGIRPRVLQPHFTSQGCQFGLKTEKPEYEAGQSPVDRIDGRQPDRKGRRSNRLGRHPGG